MPKATETSKKKSPDKVKTPFPIVGIGASAGGLEALDEFLTNIPDETGMAYVVIQHLDPTQKGMLPELLQRCTSMKVHQVKDRMRINPNCVYVIPPNRSMSILKGVLHLFEPLEIRGMRLPVDFFMRSLAEDQKERAVGVILSGMGSDGSLGLQAIKEHHGIVAVQEPETAKYDSMPRNAIRSTVVDLVAPANALPKIIQEFIYRIPELRTSIEKGDVKDKSSLEKIIILLRDNTGNDFSMYKKHTVYRRIERRMAVHKISKISSYVHFLQENPKETNILFKELMIGVTSFFRDAPVWDKLQSSVLPEIINSVEEVSILRAWVPACSTGEEAYSLAMVFTEAVEKINPRGRVSLQIFASDLDSDAIESARRAVFPANIASDVSPARLNRFFNKTEDGYQVKTEIREMVVFANHNILIHPPFTKIDILSCRNLLIYLDSQLQGKILSLFYYSLNTHGYMVLGSSETLGEQSNLFTVVDLKLKIFKHLGNSRAPELYDFPSSFSKSKPISGTDKHVHNSNENIQTMADQLLLQRFSPAGVLVNKEGDIVYISGRTGKYLEPAVGKANMNIFAMLREGLRNEFPIAFRKAVISGKSVELHNVKVGSNGTTLTVNVNIHWIDKPKQLSGFLMIIFSEVDDPPEPESKTGTPRKTLSRKKQLELEQELQEAREEIQGTHEEMQTSQEELKSTNEELQSTNEELQSTNEELTTSKEEMQSLNEELQTVNAELQSKVEDYARVEGDMKNLLNSTEIATLFLDKDLHIRRYTNQATKIFKLIKGDIGRSFTDLVSVLDYPKLADDAAEVLKTLVFIQKQVPTKDGRWFSIRIMPYRTIDDRIDGLVITFFDLSELKKIEFKLHETEQMNRSLLHSLPFATVKLSTDGKIGEFNAAAEKFFGKKRSEMIDQDFTTTLVPEKSRKKTESVLQNLPQNMSEKMIKMQVIASSGKIEATDWSVSVLLDYLKLPVGWLLTKQN